MMYVIRLLFCHLISIDLFLFLFYRLRLKVIPFVSHIRSVKKAGSHSLTLLYRLSIASCIYIEDKNLLHTSPIIFNICI